MEQFTYRVYGKGELALLYNPHITPRSACRKLQQWIVRQPRLAEALLRSGLSEKGKTFTPYQVRLIVEALGEP